jgi:hypothetical protein
MWGWGIIGFEPLKVTVRIFVHCRYTGLQIFIAFLCILFLLKKYVRLNHDVAAWSTVRQAHDRYSDGTRKEEDSKRILPIKAVWMLEVYIHIRFLIYSV